MGLVFPSISGRQTPAISPELKGENLRSLNEL